MSASSSQWTELEGPLLSPASSAASPPLKTVVFSARISPNPENWRAWLREQLLTVNLANVVLLVAVLTVSISINSTLDQQRAQNNLALDTWTRIQQQLPDALAAAAKLSQSEALLAQFNSTLDFALSLGLPHLINFTRRIDQLELRANQTNVQLTTGWVNPYTNIFSDWGESNIAVALPVPTDAQPAGWWRLDGYARMNNDALTTDAVCAGIAVDGSTEVTGSTCVYVSRTQGVMTGDNLATCVLPPVSISTCDGQAHSGRILWMRVGSGKAFGYGQLTATFMRGC